MRRNHHVVSICRYHVVFCPTSRRKVVTPPRDERLQVILAEQVERWGQDLIELEVRPDHVHLLVGCEPPVGIHRLVKRLTGSSSHALPEEFAALQRRRPSLWTNHYFVSTRGGVTLDTVQRSGESQKGT
jgi:putative transposase